MKRLTTQQFISKSILAHGNKFDYSKSIYTNTNTKVIITCSTHGEFLQSPDNHLHGKGCPKCAGNKKYTTEEFIRKCKVIHNNIYNYPKTNYINSNTKLIITCHKHGNFLQTPNHHLVGYGCPICRYDNNPNLKPKLPSQFIFEAEKLHGDKYDYSKINYKNANEKIIIICKYHGNFHQTPNHHLHKNGCPKCAKRISFGEMQFLDYINIPDVPSYRQVKIFKKEVDGYDPKTNTIYEFLGDYWHGNPNRFDLAEYNQKAHKTFGKLYEETFKKFANLASHGYCIKYIWEAAWKRFQRGIDKLPTLLTYSPI